MYDNVTLYLYIYVWAYGIYVSDHGMLRCAKLVAKETSFKPGA